jgi:hypothetical protein
MFEEPQPQDDFDLQKLAEIFGFKETTDLDISKHDIAGAYRKSLEEGRVAIANYGEKAGALIEELSPARLERARVGLYLQLAFLAKQGGDLAGYIHFIKYLAMLSKRGEYLSYSDREIIDRLEEIL